MRNAIGSTFFIYFSITFNSFSISLFLKQDIVSLRSCLSFLLIQFNSIHIEVLSIVEEVHISQRVDCTSLSMFTTGKEKRWFRFCFSFSDWLIDWLSKKRYDMVIDPTTKLKKIGWHGNIDWVLYNDNYRTFVSKLFHGFFFFRASTKMWVIGAIRMTTICFSHVELRVRKAVCQLIQGISDWLID